MLTGSAYETGVSGGDVEAPDDEADHAARKRLSELVKLGHEAFAVDVANAEATRPEDKAAILALVQERAEGGVAGLNAKLHAHFERLFYEQLLRDLSEFDMVADMEVLLAKQPGLNLNAGDGAGQTALHKAVYSNAAGAFKLLVKRGVPQDGSPDLDGGYPIHYLYLRPHNLAVAQAMVECGVDVALKHKDGTTVLDELKVESWDEPEEARAKEAMLHVLQTPVGCT